MPRPLTAVPLLDPTSVSVHSASAAAQARTACASDTAASATCTSDAAVRPTVRRSPSRAVSKDVPAAGPAVNPLIYLRQLFQARARQSDNVVPRQIAMRTQIRRWKFFSGVISLGLLVLSILWFSGRLVERNLKVAEIRKIWARQEELVAQADREREGLVLFGKKVELVRILREETGRPVPEIFLRTLPALLPASLELTHLRVELSAQKSAGLGAAPPRFPGPFRPK